MADQSNEEDDRYFDPERPSRYRGMSVPPLRRYMNDPARPLPNHHVHPSNKDDGRILIPKGKFDAWGASFPPQRSKTAVAAGRRRRSMHECVAAAALSARESGRWAPPKRGGR